MQPRRAAAPVPEAGRGSAFEATACIGLWCVAACPNASATLFTSAKVTHLGLLHQGEARGYKRVVNMLNQMDEEGFGSLLEHWRVCRGLPQQIRFDVIRNASTARQGCSFKGV